MDTYDFDSYSDIKYLNYEDIFRSDKNESRFFSKSKILEDKIFFNYLDKIVKIKDIHSYHPMKNIKYAVIMACHCNSTEKLEVIKNNLQYFQYFNINTIIINSKGFNFTNDLLELCSKQIKSSYFEIDNNFYYDFGKWIYALLYLINVNEYDYIILTNDSYIICNSINHFFNLTAIHNVELFGYNDSNDSRHHYQSYLFSLRKDAVNIFVKKVTSKKIRVKSQRDIVVNFELKMTDWFVTKDCFLKSVNNKKNNIFFHNDKLYLPLINSNVLPFIKLKRINSVT